MRFLESCGGEDLLVRIDEKFAEFFAEGWIVEFRDAGVRRIAEGVGLNIL